MRVLLPSTKKESASDDQVKIIIEVKSSNKKFLIRWWMSLGFAIVGGLIVSGHAFPYSIYAVSHGAKHVVVTTILLVCGAMTITWICDTITESGFGSYPNARCCFCSQWYTIL